jgi:phosphate-selective porin OprO/OprP
MIEFNVIKNKMSNKLILTAATAVLFLTANISEVLAQSNQNLSSRIKRLEAKFESLNKSKKYESPTLETALKNAKIFGRLQVDANWYNEDQASDNLSDGIDIVRARLGIKGKISDSLSYKFENDFSENASEIKDAYLAYTGIENTEIVFGQTKPTLSLEILESSNHMLFIQRSLAEDSVLGRLVGLKGSRYHKNWRVAAGIFGEAVGNESRNDDSKYSFSARATIAPINDEDALLHIGAATSYTSRDRVTDNTTTPVTNDSLDKEHLIGAELIARYKALTLQGEYIANHTDYDQGSGTGEAVNFASYYAQISYSLTGEYRKYSHKSAKLGKLKVRNTAGNNGIGAIELAARLSHLDRNDQSITEGQSDNYTAGVNWYPNDRLRFMLNYVRSNTSYNGSKNSEGSNAVSIRTRLYF